MKTEQKLTNEIKKALIYGDFDVDIKITILTDIEKNLWLSNDNEPLRIVLNAFIDELKDKELRLNNEN